MNLVNTTSGSSCTKKIFLTCSECLMPFTRFSWSTYFSPPLAGLANRGPSPVPSSLALPSPVPSSLALLTLAEGQKRARRLKGRFLGTVLSRVVGYIYSFFLSRYSCCRLDFSPLSLLQNRSPIFVAIIFVVGWRPKTTLSPRPPCGEMNKTIGIG